jgi:hypothetical protein
LQTFKHLCGAHFLSIMSFAFIIGFLTAIVSGVFAYLVLNRYRQRGGAHLLMWGLGLVLYFLGGLTETILNFGWNDLAFRLWYWSGALMVAAVLAQGTMHLLVRRPYVAPITSIIVGIIAFTSLVWVLSLQLDPTKFVPGGDVSKFLTESYRAILPDSAVRRILPPILNGYGTIVLVGGAIYSSYLFLRKQIMPNRVLGNVLIALGGLLPALGGSLIKLAETMPEISEASSTLKYLSIFLGVVLLFIGFQLATSPAPAPRPLPQA